MNQVYIGTNWKMHKTLKEARQYCEKLMDICEELDDELELFIIPSYTSLWPIKELIGSSKLRLGAQNMHWEDEGAFTGEISPLVLKEIGVTLVELGHSERREYYNENDEDINKKALAAINHGMKPLICIGENLAQKTNQITFETLSAQLKICLKGITKEQVGHVWIAYEPVWAIGENGIPADPPYVSIVHDNIRRVLCDLYDEAGKQIPLLYGGSVNPNNAMEYLKLPEVNGLFIGRSAWNLESFEIILTDVNNYMKEQRL